MRALIVAISLIAAAPTIAAPPGVGVRLEQSADVAAQEKAARLDVLFAELKAAPTLAIGKAVERRIWIEWIRSGDEEIDILMTAVILAMDARAFRPAIALLSRIVERKPDYAEGWNKRATLYYYMREYDKSLADIDRTLALEPRHFGALAGLGMIMQDTGNIAGAIAAFERAVAVNPSLENLKTAIGQLKARIGRDI